MGWREIFLRFFRRGEIRARSAKRRKPGQHYGSCRENEIWNCIRQVLSFKSFFFIRPSTYSREMLLPASHPGLKRCIAAYGISCPCRGGMNFPCLKYWMTPRPVPTFSPLKNKHSIHKPPHLFDAFADPAVAQMAQSRRSCDRLQLGNSRSSRRPGFQSVILLISWVDFGPVTRAARLMASPVCGSRFRRPPPFVTGFHVGWALQPWDPNSLLHWLF